MYKILSIIIYCIWGAFFLLTGLIVLLCAFLYKPLVYPLIRIMAYMNLYFLGAFPRVSGHRPTDTPYIIMYNHSSFIDIFFLPIVAPGPFTGIVAKKNLKIPVFSWILKKFEAIPIQRSNKSNAISGIEHAEKVLDRGISVGILPEGSRTLDGKMLPLKKGGFHMALNSNCNILPVGINGAFLYKPKNRWFLMPRAVEINIGTPINTSDFNIDSLDDFIMTVEKKIKELSGEYNELE